jgi:nucleotide-binding universal stress UspA family protein
VARRLAEQHFVVDSRVVVGPPAEAIIQTGAAFDLIAMATHGRSGIGRWVFGPVADKVLHGATVPVLLVRAGRAAVAAGWPRRILVPLDGSGLAEQALPLAALLARRAGAELILTCSIGWAQATADRALAIDVAGFSVMLPERAADQAHAYLTDIGQQLAAQGLTARSDIRSAPAAEAILASAAEQAADLIVMSTHGRSGLGRWTYGSVADRVLRGATLPIVLVRAGVHVPVEAPPPAPVTSAG